MSGKTIYIVTSGEYSAYGINAVFSIKEKAEAYAAQFSGRDTAWVEEWSLDEYDGHIRRAVFNTHILLESGTIFRQSASEEIESPHARALPRI